MTPAFLDELLSDSRPVVERLLEDHRVLVEPACGAALAPVYGGTLPATGPTVVVVCGGASASLEALAGWRRAVA